MIEFILGVVVGLVLGSVVYEFFTYPLMRIVFKRHDENGDKKG